MDFSFHICMLQNDFKLRECMENNFRDILLCSFNEVHELKQTVLTINPFWWTMFYFFTLLELALTFIWLNHSMTLVKLCTIKSKTNCAFAHLCYKISTFLIRSRFGKFATVWGKDLIKSVARARAALKTPM